MVSSEPVGQREPETAAAFEVSPEFWTVLRLRAAEPTSPVAPVAHVAPPARTLTGQLRRLVPRLGRLRSGSNGRARLGRLVSALD